MRESTHVTINRDLYNEVIKVLEERQFIPDEDGGCDHNDDDVIGVLELLREEDE